MIYKDMVKTTFKAIRERFPSSFLLLIDYDEVEVAPGEMEILAATEAQAFDSSEEMLAAYKQLKGTGHRLMFCSPDQKDRFIIERRPSMRVGG